MTISKAQIYRLCEKYPRRLFWHLTTNNFQLAKAFWGEDIVETPLFEKCYPECPIEFLTESWKWNLQQMVISEDPIKYLEQFLD